MGSAYSFLAHPIAWLAALFSYLLKPFSGWSCSKSLLTQRWLLCLLHVLWISQIDEWMFFPPWKSISLWNLSKPVGLQAMGDASGILTWISAWRVALTSNVSNLCSVWKYSNCTSRTHVRFSAFKFFKDEASAKPCFYSLTQVIMFTTDYLQSYYTSIGCVVSVVSGLNEIMWTPSMRISLFMYTLNLCSVLRYSNSRSPLPCLPCLWAFKREMMFYDLHFTVGDCYLLWIYAKCRSRQPISGLSLFLTCLYESTRRSSFCMSLKSQWAMIVFKKSDIHGHNWIFAPSL